jgi:hypothetical protein
MNDEESGRTIIQIDKMGSIAEAFGQTLRRTYQEIAYSVDDEGALLLDITDLAGDGRGHLTLDLKFFRVNPETPLENLCNGLHNYNPENESQEEALECAQRLLDLSDPATAAGLFVYGPPGIGKTHLAVGIAKEFMSRGFDAHYAQGGGRTMSRLGFSSTSEGDLRPNQAWVLDDVNSPYGVEMGTFKRVMLNAHNVGGRLFVTSNTPYEQLMEHGFAGDREQKSRFVDRTEGMIMVLPVSGTSQRRSKAWFARETSE